MKHLKAIRLPALLAFSLLLVVTSCKENEGCTDPAAANYDADAEKDDGSCLIGNFVLDFKALVNGVPLVMKDSVYKNVLDYYYKMETIRFYVSNLYLIKNDNSEVLVNDVSYLDLENSHRSISDDGEKIMVAAPPGDYKGIKFAIGVDPDINNGDPSVYPNDHPLSIRQNAHWVWNSGYIFLKLEGKMDTIPDGNKSLTRSFVYHCGTNALYRELSFTKNFSIVDGGTFEYNLALNVDKIFYSSTDTLDARHDYQSHSEDSLFTIAERVTDFFADAITERQ